MIALTLIISLIGVGMATTPWVSIQAAGETTVAQLSNTDASVFGDIRSSDSATGLHTELSAMADDGTPITRGDYAWQDMSPIYRNPKMDYYWGYTMIGDGTEDGSFAFVSTPKKFGEYTNTQLGWDSRTNIIDMWANTIPPIPSIEGTVAATKNTWADGYAAGYADGKVGA